MALVVSLGVPAAVAGETATFRFQPDPVEVDGEPRRTFTAAIPPGTAILDAVALTNKTDVTRTFRVFAADAREDPDTGRTAVGSFGTEPTGVGSWVRIDDGRVRQVTLAGGQQARIPFEIARPPEADVGGLAAIVAEEVADDGASAIEVSFRVAILIDARGDPDAEAGLQVLDVHVDAPLQLLPRRATLWATVANRTSRPTSVEVRFTVASLTGSSWEVPAGSFELEPGEEARVETPWLTVPETGALVELTAEATWRGGAVIARSGRIPIVPLWLPVLLVLVTAWWVRREARTRNAAPTG